MDDLDLSPVLDLGVVAALKELGGDDEPELFEELVGLFVDDAASQLASLRAALEQGDVRTLERAAHSLKSSCANIGALRMSRLCLELERRGRAGELEDAGKLVARTAEQYHEVVSALAAQRS